MKIGLSILGGLIVGLFGAYVTQYGYNNIISVIYGIKQLSYIQIYALISVISVVRIGFKDVKKSTLEGEEVYKQIAIFLLNQITLYAVGLGILFIVGNLI